MSVPAVGSDPLRAHYERDYRRTGAEGERFSAWRALGARAKADHVLDLLGGGATSLRLLDVGCGDGSLLAELASRRPGWTLGGAEIAEAAVQTAAARLPGAELRRYDGARLPWEDDAWDVVTLSHVLEHVPDPVATLREAARVAPRVVLEVPLEDNLSARRRGRREVSRAIGHLHRFSRAGARDLVARAGLTLAAEQSDPLGREVHRWTSGAPAGDAKWLLRAGVHALAPALATRLFTLHWAALARRGA